MQDASLKTGTVWFNRLRLAGIVLLFQAVNVHAASQEEADELFLSGQWNAAATAFEGLLEEEPSNARNWFRLATVFERLEEFEKAHEAYDLALTRGFQPAGRARFSMARMRMRLDDPDGALALLEEIAAAGGPHFRVVKNAPEFESLSDEPRFQAVIESLKPCTSDEHRQFDFWVGKWDVTPVGSTSPTAFNDISIVQDGCAILEEYATGYFTGMSINFYDSATQKWHQTWMSNAGGALYLEGGLRDDGAMEMTDRGLHSSAASGSVNKTVWTPLPDGSVRQVWTNSTDNGDTWTVVFDGTYRRQSQD